MNEEEMKPETWEMRVKLAARSMRGGRPSPDVSPTLHMWLWLTFHLALSHLHPSMQASFLTGPSGCQLRFSTRRQTFTPPHVTFPPILRSNRRSRFLIMVHLWYSILLHNRDIYFREMLAGAPGLTVELL